MRAKQDRYVLLVKCTSTLVHVSSHVTQHRANMFHVTKEANNKIVKERKTLDSPSHQQTARLCRSKLGSSLWQLLDTDSDAHLHEKSEMSQVERGHPGNLLSM